LLERGLLKRGSLMRRYGWIVTVMGSAAIFFLSAFFVTGLVLDDDDVNASVGGALARTGEGLRVSEESAVEDRGVGAEVVVAPATGDPLPDGFTTAELPEFNPEALVHGGEGGDGSILAGPGIVQSSGLERRTDWELIIPSAQLRAAVVMVGVSANNFLGAPDNPETIGWWEEGPAPGERGNVLFDGHRDFRDINGHVGEGVCWLLTETRPGDPVIVRDRSDGSASVYTVRTIHSIESDDPTGAEFLRASDRAMLTIVTCEGSFDEEAHNYSQRRVVVAELTDRVAPSGSGEG
jgi:sortase (surface protein transpeptidase)